MTDSQPTKLEILTQNADMRRASIEAYQMNIDNYTLAVADINENFSDDPEMQAFKTRLEELLVTERREQGKERIMLRALEAQIAQL
jgi:vancomycin permeability regulator SanA